MKDKIVVLKLQAINSEGSVVGENEKKITIPANKTIQLNQNISQLTDLLETIKKLVL